MKYLVLILCVFVTSCASNSGTHLYREKGNNDSVKIDGTFNALSNSVQIRINNTIVIDEALSILTSSGILKGTYNNQNVIADCKFHIKLFGRGYEECNVKINGKLAAILKMQS